MQKLSKIISSVIVIGTLTAGGITSFATTEISVDASGEMSSNTTISEEASDTSLTRRAKGASRNNEKLELTDEQKVEKFENIKEKLAEQLKDGKITQEQYDQAISDIAEGKKPMSLGKGKQGFANKERPELTVEQKTEIADKMKEKLAQQLEDGNVTQEQYNQAIKNIEEGKIPNILKKHRGRGQRGSSNIETPDLTDDQK